MTIAGCMLLNCHFINYIRKRYSYSYKNDTCVASTAVAQLSINGSNGISVTDRENGPQYHVKEDEEYITLFIRLVRLPNRFQDIKYFTTEATACKSM